MRARWALVGLLAVGLAGCIGVLGDFEVGPTTGGADATPNDATNGNDGTTSNDGSTVTDGNPADTFRQDANDGGFFDAGPCGHENEQCCRTQPECVLGYACQTGVCARIRPTDFGRPCDAGSQCEAGVCVNNPNGSVCGSACNQTNECPGANWQCLNGAQGQPPKVCRCSTTNIDICDGMDNDCNGIVDDHASADPYCKQTRNGTGFVCANGSCVCPNGALTNCPSSSCIDGQNDVNNCGRCNHYCNNGGTGCVNGMCQPFLWYDAGNAQIDKIHAGTSGYIHMAIQTAPTDGGAPYAQVVRCGTGSGPCGNLQVVANTADRVFDIRQDDPGGAPPLYWAQSNPPGQSGGIYSCLPDSFTGACGTITYYAQSGSGVSQFAEMFHNASDLFFHDTQGNSIRTASLAGPYPQSGGAVTVLYQGTPQHNIVHFAYDSGRFFMTEYGSTGVDRRLVSCPASGCSANLVTFDSNFTTPGFVYTDGSRVYYTDTGDGGTFGKVASCPLAGCSGATDMIVYTSASIASGASMPTEVVSDGTNVFWIANGTGGNAIYTCPVTGCTGAPTVIASNMSMRVLAVDYASVYWVQGFGGHVWRVAKP